jgi:hypothetical protein
MFQRFFQMELLLQHQSNASLESSRRYVGLQASFDSAEVNTQIEEEK